MAEKPFQNRLINQKSPYLLRHAHNLVDWYPWGDEAFQAAAQLDKPIFLSIGYATCHFCHVMIRESFEKADIASLMNEVFINVKVDREELPEIDSLYTEFAEALMATGSGWPLNLILTPQLKPFYATTYMPPRSRQEMMGVKELTEHMHELWKNDERELLLDQAEKLVELFSRSVLTRGEQLPSEESLENALDQIYEAFDPLYGGMKGTPKYPMGYQMQFFMRHALLNQDARSLFCAKQTLNHMAWGGLYDHVGGGFSRYSVDEKWIIPHFEKMLYDNALLAEAYLDAFKVTNEPFYKEITEATLNYLLRDMQHPDGGFYSAQDANTDDKEGIYYTWDYNEIQSLLAEEDFFLFCSFFNVTQNGNFNGKNVLYQSQDIQEFSSLHKIDPKTCEFRLKTCLKTLFQERKKRKKPFQDDKILVTWNAMTITALIKAGLTFEEPLYLKEGIKAAHFIEKHFWSDSKLMRRFREGDIAYEASLDDYAYLIRALIALFEAGQGCSFLQWAIDMTCLLERDFKADEGAFYQTSSDHSILLRRPELFDGSQPSGNAVHTENLLRLSQITANRELLIQAEDILKVATHSIEAYPQGACYHLMGMMHYYDKKALTLVVALGENEELKQELAAFLHSLVLPHMVVIWKPFSDPHFAKLLPHFADLLPINNQTTLHINNQGKWEKPLTTFETMQSRFT